jgi:hypothetical protein
VGLNSDRGALHQGCWWLASLLFGTLISHNSQNFAGIKQFWGSAQLQLKLAGILPKF